MKTEFIRERAVLIVYASVEEVNAMKRAQGLEGDGDGALLIHELRTEQLQLAARNRVPVEIEVNLS